MFKIEAEGKQVAEPFAEEAKYFTEVRLLQRDVKIVLESVSNQNCIGSVLHPVCRSDLNIFALEEKIVCGTKQESFHQT